MPILTQQGLIPLLLTLFSSRRPASQAGTIVIHPVPCPTPCRTPPPIIPSYSPDSSLLASARLIGTEKPTSPRPFIGSAVHSRVLIRRAARRSMHHLTSMATRAVHYSSPLVWLHMHLSLHRCSLSIDAQFRCSTSLFSHAMHVVSRRPLPVARPSSLPRRVSS